MAACGSAPDPLPVLHMDPDTLSDEAWSFQVKMAEWVENERVRRYTPTA